MKFMESSRLPGDYSKRSLAFARILHASPGTGPVDVYANGELVAKNLTYSQTAGYFTVKPCTYVICVFKAGKGKYTDDNNNLMMEKCLLTRSCIEIRPNTAVTIAIICTEPTVCLLAIPDVAGVAGVAGVSRQICGVSRACVRFVHLVPNVPYLDVLLLDGTRLFRNVPFKAHTRYRGLESGKRTLRVVPSGSQQFGGASTEYQFEGGKAYTLYALGLAGGASPLTAIITPDSIY